MTTERRVASRVRVSLPALYRSGALSVRAWVANLSRGGVYLRSNFLDQLGARVGLEVELGADVLEVEGHVARVDPEPALRGMGITFGKMTAPQYRRLANFLIERRSQTLYLV